MRETRVSVLGYNVVRECALGNEPTLVNELSDARLLAMRVPCVGLGLNIALPPHGVLGSLLHSIACFKGSVHDATWIWQASKRVCLGA